MVMPARRPGPRPAALLPRCKFSPQVPAWTMVRFASLPVIVCWLVSSSGPALGRGADPREAQARAACAAGNVDIGIALLDEIATETGDQNAIYNQARCYQQNGRTDEALSHFKEYRRRVPDLAPDEAAQVDSFIRELEAEQARKAKPEAAAALPHPPFGVELAPPAKGAPVRPSQLRLLPTALAGVSVAALLTGVFFSLRVRSIQNDLESPTPISRADFDDKMRSGQHAETYQWVSYGVAAAAATGSVLTYVMGRPAAASGSPRAGFLLLFGRGGAGGVVRLGF